MPKNLAMVNDYGYSDPEHTYSHGYILPGLKAIVSSRSWNPDARALDIGCGNGSLSNWLSLTKFTAVGIDPSESGILEAKKAYKDIEFFRLGSNDDLSGLGTFDLVTCIEVIEHCYDPGLLLRKIHAALKPDGIAIVSTPYHGYFKNLVLAITGSMDRHFTALWDGGHIKFFSMETLRKLAKETNFDVLDIRRVGRIPPLAKSMMFTLAKK